jgi:hypothetical protein
MDLVIEKAKASQIEEAALQITNLLCGIVGIANADDKGCERYALKLAGKIGLLAKSIRQDIEAVEMQRIEDARALVLRTDEEHGLRIPA